MLRGDIDPSKKVTADEYAELQRKHDFTGVVHKQRQTWLEANGYEVTRANMVDASLPSKPGERS